MRNFAVYILVVLIFYFISPCLRNVLTLQVSYIFKLVLDGNSGEVMNSHCECPAGSGDTATCKHIVGVLLMLSKFVLHGTLTLQLTCTEKIQSFKKPSRVHGRYFCFVSTMYGV